MKPTDHQVEYHRQIGRRVQSLGGDYGTRIAMEADRFNIPVSVLLAVVEQETGFRNVFGHDKKANGSPSGIPKRWMGTKVTRGKYRWYKFGRRFRGNQGVGPMQLTYPGYQDEADRDGGAWKPEVNIATGAVILKKIHNQYHSWESAYAVYNAGSVNAQGRQYAAEVTAKQHKWHQNLT